jgi:8-oxo-dGTP diphosphatase
VKYDIATPYTAVFIVFRKQDKIAFLLRSNTDWMNGHYGLPAGKVEKDESFRAAAVREAKEEVGVAIKPEDLKFVFVTYRHEESSDWINIVFEALTWEGDLYNAEPDVHGELVWFDPKDLPENMVPSVRIAIEHIEAGDSYAEYGW